MRLVNFVLRKKTLDKTIWQFFKKNFYFILYVYKKERKRKTVEKIKQNTTYLEKNTFKEILLQISKNIFCRL